MYLLIDSGEQEPCLLQGNSLFELSNNFQTINKYYDSSKNKENSENGYGILFYFIYFINRYEKINA